MPFALDIRRASFQTQHMILLHLQFGGVLNRDDPLIGPDEARQRIEQRRFSGTGAAADDHVQPSFNRPFQEHDHFRRERSEPQQVFERQRLRPETANRQRRSVDRQRRDDRVQTRAIRQASVHHRRRLINAAADLRHDAVDDLQQVFVIAKRHLVPLDAAVLFDEHVLRPVDHDVRDAGLFQQNFQRAEAERFVENFFDQPFSFRAIEQRVFGIAEVFDDEANLAAQSIPLQITEPREVQFLYEFAVNTAFEFFKILSRGFKAATRSASKSGWWHG